MTFQSPKPFFTVPIYNHCRAHLDADPENTVTVFLSGEFISLDVLGPFNGGPYLEGQSTYGVAQTFLDVGSINGIELSKRAPTLADFPVSGDEAAEGGLAPSHGSIDTDEASAWLEALDNLRAACEASTDPAVQAAAAALAAIEDAAP